MSDDDIDFSDIPELDDEFWANAVLQSPPAKQPISIRLDQHVLEYFKARGKGYQTLINSVLRSYVWAQLKVDRSAAEPPSLRAFREQTQASFSRKPTPRRASARKSARRK